MSPIRRQRQEPPLMLLLVSILLQLIQQLECQISHTAQLPFQQQQQQQQYNSLPSATAARASNQNNNNFLVTSNIINNNQLFAQSLPLTRQFQQSQQQQQTDLDNVIESTTSQAAPAFPYNRHQQSQTVSQAASAASCQLPLTWAGKWHQANKEPIRVTNTEISDKGLCRDQKGDKYLFEYLGNTKQPSQQAGPCLVCLVINERHLNVLQYKESSCQQIPPNYYNRTTNQLMVDQDHSLLDSICSDITGDAQLESLFRLDTPAIECPISGQFAFTYDSCREPQSSLDSCIDKKQLNFKFSACPDVPGSESKSETLKCYADWSEGNNYYMIGRLEHASNHQDKGKFRCFVYEKSSDGKFIQMAQSLEESCYGLINANEGPKTLRLSVKPPTTHKCHFPSYIQSQSENWLSVDNSLIYMFNQNSTKYQVKETKEGTVIEEATCLQQFAYHGYHNQPLARSSGNQQVVSNRRYPPSASSPYQTDQSKPVTNNAVYLVQITKNWIGCWYFVFLTNHMITPYNFQNVENSHTTNYCVRFYKRSNGIVQIDYFTALNGDNQCRSAYTGMPQTQIITSTNLEHQRCPFEGAYTIEAPVESDLTYNPSNIFICPRQSFLTAQCEHPSRLRIHSRCSPSKFFIKNLYCLGSWTTNGLVRLLLADDERQRYSAWYRDYGAISSVQDGASLPEAQALQQQQPTEITRSQQLLAASNINNNNNNNQYLTNSLAPIVDLQIALITPFPIIAKPMQVRLTRRNQCSDLRGYISQGSYPPSAISSSRYASATASSSAVSLMVSPAYFLHSSMLILFVTLLLSFVNPNKVT